VTSHKETPGLGDYIDPKKDRNKARPWITQFNGLGFDGVPREKWRVKKDGGHFDQMSGATISARAVTNASGRALAWATENRDKLFALPANGRFDPQENHERPARSASQHTEPRSGEPTSPPPTGRGARGGQLNERLQGHRLERPVEAELHPRPVARPVPACWPSAPPSSMR
jgi:hypothetical protein